MAKQPEFRKYLPLEAWFRDQPKTAEQIELTVDQVEAILGSSLPKSATKLQTWWTNVAPKIQSHRTAWLNNGWRVTEFDQQARRVKIIGMEREGGTSERRSVMKKNVLVIQGGGEGAYAADKKLAASLAMYAAKLPQATINEFDSRGHQFLNDLSEVAADILSLSMRRLSLKEKDRRSLSAPIKS